MNDIVMKLREYAQNNKEDEGCSLMLEAADAIENLKKTPESAASKKVRKFFRKNPVFHAIMLDTWETSMRLQYENEHVPYRRRHVSFELTDEQTEIITGEYIGRDGVIPQFETLGEVWIEGAINQLDVENIKLYHDNKLSTLYVDGEWSTLSGVDNFVISQLWENHFNSTQTNLPENFKHKADGFISHLPDPSKETGYVGWVWWANNKIGIANTFEQAKRFVEEEVRGDVSSFIGTWPGDETDNELLEALSKIE